jgi:hypothetical protein
MRTSAVVATMAIAMLGAGAARAEVVEIGPNLEVVVDGEPFLPIMQWLQSPSRIPDQASLGINTFVGNGAGDSSSTEMLDICEANGVHGVVDPGDMSVADHPALLGWIFGDEPDLDSNAVEPADIAAEYAAIKAADPLHPTFLTLTAGFYSEFDPPGWMGGSRERYFAYADATDLVGFDLYPIYGWCQEGWLYRVGAAQEELAATYAPGVATYQWIEAVRTSSQWCELEARGEDDGPTAEEIRNEVWQALAHGARAIGYFTHSWECPGYTQFCLSDAQQAELARTNAQLTALARPILAPRSPASIAVSSGGARVDWFATEHDGRLYVFAVNVDRAAATVAFAASAIAPDATVDVIDEARSVNAAAGTFTDDFAALAVHLYSAPLAGAPDGDADADADADGDADGGDDGCSCVAAPRRSAAGVVARILGIRG